MLSDKVIAALAKVRQSNLTDDQKDQAIQELVAQGIVPQFELSYHNQTNERLKNYIEEQSKLKLKAPID
jgi:hypothetical protein